MALTQQQIDAFDKASGLKTNPIKNSRTQELKDLASKKANQNIFQKVGGDIKNTFQQEAESYGAGKSNIVEASLRGTGAIAKGATDIIGAGIEAIPGVKNIETGIGTTLGKAHEVAMKDASYKSVVSDIQNAAKKYQDWATKNPELAKDVGAVGNIANAALTISGTEAVIKGVAENALVKKGVSKVGEKVLGTVTSLGEGADKKILDNTWKMIQPELNATEKDAAVKAGQVSKEGLLKTTTLNPNSYEKEMVDVASKYTSTAKNEIEAVANMEKGIVDEATQLRSGLSKSKAIWNQNDLKGVINKIERPHLLSGDLEKAFDKTLNVVLDKAKGAKKSLDGLLDVRQDFDAMVKQQYPNLYSSDTMTPIKQAVTKTRNAINDLIEGKIPLDDPAAIGFKESLRKQSLLYSAIDNTAPKVGKIGKNSLQDWFKENPGKANLIKYGATAAVGGGAAAGINAITH